MCSQLPLVDPFREIRFSEVCFLKLSRSPGEAPLLPPSLLGPFLATLAFSRILVRAPRLLRHLLSLLHSVTLHPRSSFSFFYPHAPLPRCAHSH